MLKINIANTEFEYRTALETEEYYNGSSRRTYIEESLRKLGL